MEQNAEATRMGSKQNLPNINFFFIIDMTKSVFTVFSECNGKNDEMINANLVSI